MRKQILAVSLAVASTAMGQSVLSTTKHSTLEPAPQKAIDVVEKNAAAIMNRAANKTSAGPIDQRMGHWIPVDDLYDIGGTGSGLSYFIDPTFIDSTADIDFGTRRAVDNHAVGQAFDPTSEAFGFVQQDYFTENDDYYLDTVYVAGFYDIITQGLQGTTGDKLRLEVIWGPATDDNVFRTGISFNANTWDNQPDPITLAPLRYTGSNQHGDQGSLDWSGKMTMEYDMTVNDSNNVYFAFPINNGNGQMIPAGSIVGVSIKFVPGYTWTPGDMYFSGSGGSSPAVLNSWRALQAGVNTQNDNTGYFMEQINFDPTSMATSQYLPTGGRYGTYDPNTQQFLNEMMFPGNLGYIIEFWVHGNSSLSVGEDIANTVKVYPNPTDGIVNVNFGEANGTYNVQLVNIIGQTVFSSEVEVTPNQKESFNFEGLDNGVYLLNINGNGMNKVQKITIK
jgi:hypothetical protein